MDFYFFIGFNTDSIDSNEFKAYYNSFFKIILVLL